MHSLFKALTISYLAVSHLVTNIFESSPEWFEKGLSEYDLITKLQNPPHAVFDKDALRDPLNMFQTHFIVFHCLYQAQSIWLKDKIGFLDIHSTHIVLRPIEGNDQSELARPDPLRDYYLSWDNYKGTDTSAVETLLDDFWRKYIEYSYDNVYSATEVEQAQKLLVLSREEASDKTRVKKQYRRLQHQHHPDKGGDPETSKQILHAYIVLCNTSSKV